uniref:Uncharacterized protein n=1 Tax=Papilio xuthus TaxID=66420 RepID=I4DLN1_PAPXU|nr:unknown unsecreted protein [Papilio xuthus]
MTRRLWAVNTYDKILSNINVILQFHEIKINNGSGQLVCFAFIVNFRRTKDIKY